MTPSPRVVGYATAADDSKYRAAVANLARLSTPLTATHSIDQGLPSLLSPFESPPPGRWASLSHFVSLKSVASRVASGSLTLEEAATAAVEMEAFQQFPPPSAYINRSLSPGGSGQSSHRLRSFALKQQRSTSCDGSGSADNGKAHYIPPDGQAAAVCISAPTVAEGISFSIAMAGSYQQSRSPFGQRRFIRKTVSFAHLAPGNGLPSPRSSCHGSIAEDGSDLSSGGCIAGVPAGRNSCPRVPQSRLSAGGMLRRSVTMSPVAMDKTSRAMPNVRSRLHLPIAVGQDSAGLPSECHGAPFVGSGSTHLLRAETDLDRICRAAHVVCEGRNSKQLGEAMSEIRIMNKVWTHHEPGHVIKMWAPAAP